MRQPDETTSYAQMGMAALLPGMVHMLELMQEQLNGFRAHLASLQGMKNPGKARAGAKGGKSGWSDDPKERSREMKRRMMLADRKRKQHGQPTVRTELSKRRAKEWAAMPAAKKKARLAAMLAGRQRALSVVKLERAS